MSAPVGNTKIGSLAFATKGKVQAKTDDSALVSGTNQEGEVTDSVSLQVDTDSTKTGWWSKRHDISLEDTDGNPNLDFQLREENGTGFVTVTNTNDEGFEAQVKTPVGPLNAVEKYFDPESPWSLLPEMDAIEKVGIEREGRDVSIEVTGDGRTQVYNFGRHHFSTHG